MYLIALGLYRIYKYKATITTYKRELVKLKMVYNIYKIYLINFIFVFVYINVCMICIIIKKQTNKLEKTTYKIKKEEEKKLFFFFFFFFFIILPCILPIIKLYLRVAVRFSPLLFYHFFYNILHINIYLTTYYQN
jgi:hypothetical protein